jgi:AAA ATPase domain
VVVVDRNPFRPSFGTSPPKLAGRGEILALVDDALAEGPGAPARAALFVGQRGMGKTVLLNGVEDLARARGWLTIAETGHAGLVERLAGDHLGPALRAHDPDAERRTITSVGAPLGLGSISWATEQQHRRMTGIRFDLVRLADLCAANGTGVLITVDEVHAADVAELRELTTVVQHCFREEREVALVAAGLPAGVGARLLDDEVLTFLRRAERFEVGPVGETDVVEALREPIEAAGRSITAAALGVATRETAGYPFLIQLVGYHSWRQDPAARVIDAGHVVAALPAVRERLGRLVIEPALARLSERDRDFLVAMSVDDTTSRVRDVATRMGVDGNYANQYRRRLLDTELIVEAGRGRVSFHLPGLRAHLRALPGRDAHRVRTWDDDARR